MVEEWKPNAKGKRMRIAEKSLHQEFTRMTGWDCNALQPLKATDNVTAICIYTPPNLFHRRYLDDDHPGASWTC